MSRSSEPVRVLFVCMGNICRSPLAEGVFRHRADERGVLGRFEIDSAGTGGWHAGHPADERMQRVAKTHGIDLTSCARQVRPADFTQFDDILCADRENLRDLIAMGAPKERTRLLLSVDPHADVDEVPDPYYGGEQGFQRVFELVDRACTALLDHHLETD